MSEPDQALVDAIYRALTAPKEDWKVDETGISFRMDPADLALIRAAGSEKKLKRAVKEALARKTAEDLEQLGGR